MVCARLSANNTRGGAAQETKCSAEAALAFLMVAENSVLVIGAGGSIPYGYPSGEQLVSSIISFFRSKKLGLRNEILERFNFSEGNVLEFCSELESSSLYSIDAFLEKRPEYIEIGKAGIASILIPLEGNPLRVQQGDWYRYVINRTIANFEAGEQARLTILTFNYDRSLDCALYESFITIYKNESAKLTSLLSRLKIKHLHGLLAPLPAFSEPPEYSREYGDLENIPDSVYQSSRAIKIIHEVTVDEQFKSARQALLEARCVCFLGFGYHRLNLGRLIHHPKSFTSDRKVYGSSHGMTTSERGRLEALFGGGITMSARDCLTFLRENAEIFS